MSEEFKHCDVHSKKLYLYCEPCCKTLCILCVPDHNGEDHKLVDYQTFYKNFMKLQTDFEEVSTKIEKLTKEFTTSLDKFVSRKQDETVKINEDFDGLVKFVQDTKPTVVDNFSNTFEAEVNRVTSVKDALTTKATESNEKHDLVRKLKSDLGQRFTEDNEYFCDNTEFTKIKELEEYVSSCKEALEKEFEATITDIAGYDSFFGTNARISKKLTTLLTDNYQFKPVSLKVNIDGPQEKKEGDNASKAAVAKQFYVLNNNMWYRAGIATSSEDTFEYMTSYFIAYNTVIVSSVTYTRAEFSKTTNQFGMGITEAEAKAYKEKKKEVIQLVSINGYFYKLVSHKTVSDTTYEVEYSYPPTTYKTTVEKSAFEIKEFITFEALGETEVNEVINAVVDKEAADLTFEEGEEVVVDWYGFFPGVIEEKEATSWKVKVTNNNTTSTETIYDSESYKLFKVINEKNLNMVQEGSAVIVKLHTSQWGEFQVASVGESDLTIKSAQGPEMLIKFPQENGPNVALKTVHV